MSNRSHLRALSLFIVVFYFEIVVLINAVSLFMIPNLFLFSLFVWKENDFCTTLLSSCNPLFVFKVV